MPVADILGSLIGRSRAMDTLRERIERVARSPVPVLIVGETGTGKEVCAAAIAQLSGRSPYYPFNCAAVAESLIDSELFGHERGAFTGAVRDHSGVIAAAHGGVLFLDELPEVPAPAQAKLLRVLESGEYRPVGSKQISRSDFRVIAATNEDPDGLVARGRLRADLLHRLGAVRLMVAPLRQRIDDIPLLIDAFVHRFGSRIGQPCAGVSSEACSMLMAYHWPGNVRQLRNVVEAAVAIAGPAERVRPSHVREVLDLPLQAEPPSVRFPTLAETRRRAEELAIEGALSETHGNREAAARLLGISEATLYRKMSTERAVPLRPGDSQV